MIGIFKFLGLFLFKWLFLFLGAHMCLCQSEESIPTCQAYTYDHILFLGKSSIISPGTKINSIYFVFHYITLQSENIIFYPAFWFQEFSW